MIVFENEGEMDLRAVTTFGVNVKVIDSPIGYFGTGLKYAIAVLLRHGQEITIFCGEARYHFSTKHDDFRGENFDFIRIHCAHGSTKELGFTTELGKNWDLWMAYRELYCNTKDEGGETYKDTTLMGIKKGVKGKTRILVKGDDFDHIHQNRSEFILETVPDKVGALCEAHVGAGTSIFYKGIRVLETGYKALFNYNLTGTVDLTEDRTLRYQFYAKRMIMDLITKSDDHSFIEKALTGGRERFEHYFDYTDWEGKPGEAFMHVVDQLRADSFDTNPDMNVSAIVLHKKLTHKDILPTESCELTTVQQAQYDRAFWFVQDTLGCNMERYPIILCESLGPGHLGRAANRTIYVSLKAFDMGTKWVAAALYEEFIHLSEGVEDDSHGQKMVYLEKILSLGEQLNGQPL